MKVGRDILRDARVMVVGCGALGNEVLKNLALCGVGHVVCVDFDRVEAGNLSRSVLFRQRDADDGRLKVEVVRDRLLELNPELDIRTFNGDIVYDIGLGIIRSMDVIVSCVDSRWARFIINRHCIRMDRPWVDGGIAMSEGTARVFLPGRNCYACSLDPELLGTLKRRLSCPNVVRAMERSGSAPTTSLTASVIGAVQAQEAIKVICGDASSCGRMFHYDGDTLSCGTAEFTAYDDGCPEHEVWGPVEQSPFDEDCTLSCFFASFPDGGKGVSVLLREDSFVDYVTDRRNGEKIIMMMPVRRVAESLPEGAFPEDFYQNEFRTVDENFPYPNLTFRELGIPYGDVLHVRSAGKDRFLELKWA